MTQALLQQDTNTCIIATIYRLYYNKTKTLLQEDTVIITMRLYIIPTLLEYQTLYVPSSHMVCVYLSHFSA